MQTGLWKCDTCGQIIKRPVDGWVEWLRNIDSGEELGLRLVHHKPASPIKTEDGCQYNERDVYALRQAAVQDVSLEEMLGDNGLMDLLHLIAEKKLPIEEVLEMIKRLHVANYEQARPYLDSAVAQSEIDQNMLPGFYSQNDLLIAIDWGKRQQDE